MPAACLLALVIAPVHAQQGAKNGEWPTYGGDLGNSRYSALDQINASNFNKLEVAWRFKTDSLGPRVENNLEGTPLMVKGILYATAGTRRSVVALDAATGELLWVHGENEGERGAVAPRQLSGRGLAYWTNGTEERIIYVTAGYRMIALNAKTGQRIPAFGKDGVVDLKEDDDQPIDLMSSEIGLHATPMIAQDVVVVGAAHKPGGVPTSKTNVKGYVRAFDVKTGKRLWTFHTIPKPGEPGLETWLNDSWSYTGNTGSWGQSAIDEQLGTVYLGIELPTGDYYGGHRPGPNLYGESLVAVDLHTGKMKWYYQYVHHGIWDMDNPCPPILADINVNGQMVKAVAQPTKQAFLYVLNRETGKPVWPFEERPVEKGTVPGEWYSPTQPFPTKPPAYDRQGFLTDYLIDFTPELHAEAEKLVQMYKIGPIFTPPSVSKPEGPLATLTLATAGGGSNWPGGSYDPETHMVYVSSQAGITPIGLIPGNKARTDMDFQSGQVQPAGGRGAAGGRGGAAAGRGAQAAGRGGPDFVPSPATQAADPEAPPAPAAPAGGGGGVTVQGLPLIKPPYGSITAINLDRGDIAWQVAHGDTPDNIRNHPLLRGMNIPRTGRPGTAGQVVTRTLVVVGEKGVVTMPDGRRGAYLRAYNKGTGKDAGAVYMPAPQTGSPMTYMLNGKQYIVVAIGSNEYGAEYRAYRLPN
ncbi:MAG: PQQ-binding-like beta-propeller repeat protein [Bryobacterales bacterium]|nr:PQQ-binding-like beta-propeller repeat protein [Bryobacterales bacterium]MBV9401972.1 PQQ-binding-like beta-propeller repeat protein [Bryobacterales bacterium]